ncbi:hypothetical protein K9853_13995, partial [Lacticaseibacillus paracasei]|uniref:hypothetical protein n=1 Tax=Lacticaseibacillus paracasei TaxID=1597 RepID=UPI001EE135DE
LNVPHNRALTVDGEPFLVNMSFGRVLTKNDRTFQKKSGGSIAFILKQRIISRPQPLKNTV